MNEINIINTENIYDKLYTGFDEFKSSIIDRAKTNEFDKGLANEWIDKFESLGGNKQVVDDMRVSVVECMDVKSFIESLDFNTTKYLEPGNSILYQSVTKAMFEDISIIE